MSRMLERAAAEANAAAAGLQIFHDNIPDNDIDGCIQELLALAHCYTELDLEYPDYARISARLAQDVHISIRSLTFTLRHVRDMFGDTRSTKASGGRPYRRAWEELKVFFVNVEGDFGLLARLETYSIFVGNVVGSLRGDRVEPGEIVRDRERINSLLEKQEAQIRREASLEDRFAGFSFVEPPEWVPPPPHIRPPMQHLHGFPFPPPPPPPPLSTWSDGSDPFVMPTAPEPPRPWGSTSPTSPTLSSNSFQTWASASSGGPPVATTLSHWATRVFDGKHTKTAFRARGEPSICYGHPDPPTCVERLRADGFIEVLRLPLDATRVYARLYWRPSDHRARLLLTVKDSTAPALKYCIPLTALKLKRNGPNLHLFRYSTEEDELKIWAKLSFTQYEQLILFYCAFAAMKSQDWRKYPPILEDKIHKRERSEEIEEWAGEIKDDNYLHAVRIYRDKDSGGIRLEARARRGNFTLTPIWTAFITEDVDDAGWIKRISPKLVQLKNLTPYVFCHGYSPPRGKSGNFQLRFTTITDANGFMNMINNLAIS
ncbi:hypothetical protein EJ08DRAFT_193635 [Tothia fuscella]|uniref:Uncharacterized protein n=1 Tax=Tothia fuscella TaxID=1048955 RepID=A0A9P4TZC6_9PEZI|nr:hypothetical protein EJ08DRAFT_193635 [Tothia fuscella]